MDSTTANSNIVIFGHCSCSDSGVVGSRSLIISRYTGFRPRVLYTKSIKANKDLFPDDVIMPRSAYCYLYNLSSGLWTDLKRPSFPDDDMHKRIKQVLGEYLINDK